MSWQLFDRLAAFFRSANIYRGENLLQDQTSLHRITAGGEFVNFSSQHSILEQTNLQINRLERYKDFDQMDEVGEIHAALDMYADEASLIDPEIKHSILVKAKTLRVKDEVEDFLYNVLVADNITRPMVRYLCKFGDAPFEIIPTQNRTGVASIRHMNVYNFTRVETKFGDLVGFFYQDELQSNPTFFHPWQVMHLRLTSFESIYNPYGRSILDGARKHFKQLRLMEDAALVYRLTRAPEKRVFTIPVGNIPAKDVPQFIQLIARDFKKKKFFDPASGDVNERWNPLIQEDDYWLPQRADGTGPTVDTLPGAENLDQIADIEYFKKKMVSALKIPFSRVGIGEPSEGDQQPLSKVAPEFAKAMQWIQREVTTGLKKVVICHLAMKGFSADDIKGFDLYMTASSAIDELYRIETWASRAEVIAALKDTGLFPDEWILQRFTPMTLDEIDQMKELAEERKAQAAVDELLGPTEAGVGEGDAGSDLLGGGDEPPGAPGGGPGGEGEEPMGPLPLEGLNTDLEKQVLNEYKEFNTRKGAFKKASKDRYWKKVQRLAETILENRKINSKFEAMMNANEFDQLPMPWKDDQTTDGDSLIPRRMGKDVFTEAYKVAKGLILSSDDPKKNVISEDITIDDLPL